MTRISHYLIIRAEPSTVYRAIAEQSGLQAWWTGDVIAKPEVGTIAEFKFGDRYHNKMKIVRLEADSLVEWECVFGDPEWIGTALTFQLERKNEQTVLRFQHGNWRKATDFFASCNYHWGYYLRSLKLYCETGTGTPFTDEN
jgi:uncharacterized protein YndB with AHSA1/START domain